MLDRAIALLVTAISVAPGLPLGGESWRSGQLGAAEAGELEVGFGTITSDELAEKLAHKDFVFVNVHIPYEGEIERTDAFIPFDKVPENLDRLPADRDAAIVLYCRSGRMSEIAASELAGRGFTQVSHLAGGMVDWQNSGREIQRR